MDIEHLVEAGTVGPCLVKLHLEPVINFHVCTRVKDTWGGRGQKCKNGDRKRGHPLRGASRAPGGRAECQGICAALLVLPYFRFGGH